MGGNCSPLLADIFLIFCKFPFMQKLMKEKKKIRFAKILSHTCHYVDYICVVNYNFFDRHLHKIYPDNLIENRSVMIVQLLHIWMCWLELDRIVLVQV